ncbi:DciA family protein [Utexia brackfieldae]|uniref:DUF721 domain-containing protein n=1 Tax=Utexia brackfieldae TaxID=3074108 RepID=UPI00370D463B
MRKSAPQTFDSLLDDVSSLKKVQERAIALTKLNQTLKSLLPLSLQKQCRAANYRQHRLIVEVSSASWLTRLRYEQEKLLLAFRQSILPGLAAIDFIINPNLNTATLMARSDDPQPPTSYQPKRQLSQNSAQMLEVLAENCPDNLKQQLMKLAQHAKPQPAKK